MPSFIPLLLVLVIFLVAFGYMTISYHRTIVPTPRGEPGRKNGWLQIF